MAAPVVTQRVETPFTSSGDPLVPFTANVGDLVMVFLSIATAQTITLSDSFTNWTNNNANSHMFYKVIDGTEGGNVQVTLATNCKAAAVAYTVQAGTFASSIAPVSSTVATGTSANPNATAASPTGSAKDYLYFTWFYSAGEEADDDTWVSLTPTGYTNTVQVTSGTASTASTNCSLASAEFRTTNTTTQDPVAWTMAQSLAWRAYTVAVYPVMTGSFTASAIIRSPESGSFTADAIQRRTYTPTGFTADAIKAVAATTVPGSFGADAVKLKASGTLSFTAAAVIKKTIAPLTVDIPPTEPGNNVGFGYSGEDLLAQSFTATSNGVLRSITALLAWSVSQGSDAAYAQLQTDAAGIPSGTVLASSSTVPASSMTQVPASFTVDIVAPVVSGTTYWVVWTRTTPLGSGRYALRSTIGSTYSGGQGAWHDDTIPQWFTTSYDFVHSLYIATLTIDAVLLKNSGSLSFTAAAVISKTLSPSFSAAAVIKKTLSPSLAADAIRLRTMVFGVGGGTTIAQDDFSNAAGGLNGQALDIGGTWSQWIVGSQTAWNYSGSGRATNLTGGTVSHEQAGSTSDADLVISVAHTTNMYAGVYARGSETAGPNYYYYAAEYNPSTGALRIRRQTGAQAQGATVASTTLSTGAKTLRFRVSGSSPTDLKVRAWSGAEPGTWDLDTTDNTAANQAASGWYGILAGPAFTTAQVDDFLVVSAGSPVDGPGPTLDALISKTTSGSFTANAITTKTATGTFTADADVFKTIASSFTVDADIAGAGVTTVPGSFTADSIILTPRTGSFTAGADVLAALPGAFTADAVVQATRSGTFAAAAVISKTISPSFTAAAIIKKTVTGSFVADAIKQRTFVNKSQLVEIRLGVNNLNFGRTTSQLAGQAFRFTGSNLRLVSLSNYKVSKVSSPTGDAVLQLYSGSSSQPTTLLTTLETIPNAEVDGRLRSLTGLDIPLDSAAWYWLVFSSTVAPDATNYFAANFLTTSTYTGTCATFNGSTWGAQGGDLAFVIEAQSPFVSDAVIRVTQTGSLTADALLLRVQLGSLTANAVLFREQSAGFAADAIITSAAERFGSLTADAVIQRTQAGSFTANAVVRQTVAGAFVSDAVIQRTQAGSFTANAVVRQTVAGGFTADAIRLRTSGDWEAAPIGSSPSPVSFGQPTFKKRAQSFIPAVSGVLSQVTWAPTRVNGTPPDNAVLELQSDNANRPSDIVLAQLDVVAGSALPGAAPYGSRTVPCSVAVTAGVRYWLVAHRDGALDNIAYGWASTGDLYPNGGISSYTTSWLAPGTNDMLFTAYISPSFAADAWLVATRTGSFTASATIFGTHTGFFTADAVKSKSQAGSFIASADILKAQAGSFAANAVFLRAASATFLADAIKRVTTAGSFTASAIVKRTATTAFVSDAVLVRTQPGSFTANAVVRRTAEVALAVDAVVRRVSTASLTTDAIVRRAAAGSFSADATIYGTVSRSFTASAVVMPTFTANAIVRRVQSASFTASAVVMPIFRADATIKATLAHSFTANAFIRSGTSGFVVADADIKATLTGAFVADAIKQKTAPASFLASAVFSRTLSTAFTASAIVRTTVASTFATFADIKATVSAGVTASSVILAPRTGTFSADASITSASGAIFTANAVLRRANSGTFSADACLLRTSVGSFTAQAVLLTSNSRTLTASAVLATTRTFGFSANAVSLSPRTGSFIAQASLTRGAAGTFTADAVLRSTASGTFRAEALKQTPQAGSFTAQAYLIRRVLTTLTAAAVLQREATGSLSAKAVVKTTVNGTVGLFAVLAQPRLQVLVADAVVRKVEQGQLTSNALLLSQVHRSFVADALARRTTSDTFSADAVLASRLQFTADAVIRGKNDFAFDADAVITVPHPEMVATLDVLELAATLRITELDARLVLVEMASALAIEELAADIKVTVMTDDITLV